MSLAIGDLLAGLKHCAFESVAIDVGDLCGSCNVDNLCSFFKGGRVSL